ncbi:MULTISPECIES: endolytic transglycosylase MltG [Roseobacter]|uniref:Endolytic murein transglycosylase n=1 Tax=Roseobacter litoralis (strain ATCC 49566 / DSM 6996 / JCM 21268 / NBRC 15278 / OCh 149) TaxID=391595 RepID=F7ZE76_ROSLO|nr:MULTISPECIES: endolytic transglycosylase MltG [Roseobacter]AEI93397.1 aminodeoxychorismate lyase [Roseobacter litoralis Och 149]GIT85317.1 branched-chain alpha-keto acid dehydrogenase subunit E2 [Roseobacter sp. OBYS 0001]
MWRHIASNAVTMLIVLLFMVGGVILWGKTQYDGAGPLSEAMCVEVPSGSTMRRISETLEESGAVTSGAIFRMGAEYAEKANQLKAGSYLVPPGASMAQIIDTVTRGGASTCGTEVVYRIGVNRVGVQLRELNPQTNQFEEMANFNPATDDVPEIYTDRKAAAGTRFRVALAEGVTSWQIVEGLKAMDVLEGSVETLPAEGALAPDSYEVRPGDQREDVLQRMRSAQERRVAEVWENRQPDLPIETPEELLILASIIEKETAIADERGQVASVFVNRLNRGMRLQTDPTVIYGVTEGKGVLGRGLRRSELRAATPWNTYVIEGLPPTPIANPGLASLEAAAAPLETPYIFFVADGTGGHAFAETLAEHNRNVAQWRRIEAEQAEQSSGN